MVGAATTGAGGLLGSRLLLLWRVLRGCCCSIKVRSGRSSSSWLSFLLLLHHQTALFALLAFEMQVSENVIHRVIVHIVLAAVVFRSGSRQFLRRTFRHGVLPRMLLMFVMLVVLTPCYTVIGWSLLLLLFAVIFFAHSQTLHCLPRASFGAVMTVLMFHAAAAFA